MFKLPLSDSDRAALRKHAVLQGKSPNVGDEQLLAIWKGGDVPAPSIDKDFLQSVELKAIEAAVAAVQIHRPVQIEIKQGSAVHKLPNEHRHAVFEKVLRALSVRENVYLVGPAGSGKTTIASQVAKALNIPFYSTGAVGMAYQLQGFINAEGRYMETDLYRAYVNGGVFLFDEIDASSAQALLAFNAIAANDLAAFPCGTVKRHEDFVIIAAANTFGNGADAQYVGRAQLDAATLDRFAFVPMDYDEKLELAIASNDEWTRHVQTFRKAVRELGLRHVVSPRASVKGGKLLSAGLSWDDVEAMVLTRGLSALDVEKIKSNLPKRIAA